MDAKLSHIHQRWKTWTSVEYEKRRANLRRSIIGGRHGQVHTKLNFAHTFLIPRQDHPHQHPLLILHGVEGIPTVAHQGLSQPKIVAKNAQPAAWKCPTLASPYQRAHLT
jgi:hypothetical protein